MLTAKRETFAAGLAEGLTQAEAHRRAYPTSRSWKDASVWDQASKLAAVPEVRHRVEELKAKTALASEVKLERIAQELARLGLYDVRKLVRNDGTPLGLHELDDETARVIVGIDVVTIGNADVGIGQVLKFKLADKGANLERLAKLLGYFERDNTQKKPEIVLTGFRMVVS